MKTKIKNILTAAAIILSAQISFAGNAPDELIKAITAGEEDKAISMIPGTDINLPDAAGNTALVAAANYYTKVTKALIDAKADLNLPSKAGLTPLYSACRWGNVEAVKMLMDA